MQETDKEKSLQNAIHFQIIGNYKESLEIYSSLIIQKYKLDIIHNNIGLIYYNQNNKSSALYYFKKAIKLNESFAEAHNNLAALYNDLSQFNKAIKHCNLSAKINSNFSATYNNLGNAYDGIGNFLDAETAYLKAINIDPKNIEAYNNLGSMYKYECMFAKAVECYNSSIKINPNWFKSKKNLGLVHLLLKNFKLGFKFFESRIEELEKVEYKKLNLNSKKWNGEDLDDKTILIISEQGFGDSIQFSRYLYNLLDTYKVKVLFKVSNKIKYIFENKNIFTFNNEIPKHDYHVYLLSLPKIYFEKEKKLLKQNNFIRNDPEKFQFWKKKLESISAPKIGINWQGNKNFKGDSLRSISLVKFEKIINIKKLNFINLQKGFGEEQIENFQYKDKLHNFSDDVDTGENAFEDTIAIIKNLDLVITSCTSIAHLSATLEVETWILLNTSPDWRWFLDSDSSPWYKNVKLFRQKDKGNWESVFDQVKEELLKKI